MANIKIGNIMRPKDFNIIRKIMETDEKNWRMESWEGKHKPTYRGPEEEVSRVEKMFNALNLSRIDPEYKGGVWNVCLDHKNKVNGLVFRPECANLIAYELLQWKIRSAPPTNIESSSTDALKSGQQR